MTIPAAWHPDPTGRHQHRYWDGTVWTEHVANHGQVGRDPLPGSDSTSAVGGAVADTGGMPGTGTESSSAGADGVASTAVPAGEGVPPGDPAAGATDRSIPAQPASEQQQPPNPQQPAAHPQPGETAQQEPAAPVSTQQPSPNQGPPPAQPGGYPALQPGGFPAQQPAAASGQSNGIALAALIVGLLSLAIAWIPFIGLLGVVGGFVALLLGVFGRGRAKKIANGAGMAITGIISGIVAILLGVASTVLPVLFFQGLVGDFEAVDACIEETGDEEACIEEHAPWWLQWLDDAEDFEN